MLSLHFQFSPNAHKHFVVGRGTEKWFYNNNEKTPNKKKFMKTFKRNCNARDIISVESGNATYLLLSFSTILIIYSRLIS